jgi:uncharacterized cofD-like protein
MEGLNTINGKRIVCLGGGIGTSNLIRGLKKYGPRITVITSMADDGGSSGRLRKAYGIMPPGDLISCIAALISDENKEMASLLTYRIPGDSRNNKSIDGQKFGNLLMLAEISRTNDFYKALEVTKKMFGVTANILPATDERIRLSAITIDGRRVHGETALDVAKYAEPMGLKRVFITPKHPVVNRRVIDSLKKADIIISGPGDLYTNQLPVLIVPQIKENLLKAKCRKIFVLNIANKPYETKGYSLKDFIMAIKEHLGSFPFDTIIVNKEMSFPIPQKYSQYTYIPIDDEYRKKGLGFKLIEADCVNDLFPIYHSPQKLANIVVKHI